MAFLMMVGGSMCTWRAALEREWTSDEGREQEAMIMLQSDCGLNKTKTRGQHLCYLVLQQVAFVSTGEDLARARASVHARLLQCVHAQSFTQDTEHGRAKRKAVRQLRPGPAGVLTAPGGHLPARHYLSPASIEGNHVDRVGFAWDQRSGEVEVGGQASGDLTPRSRGHHRCGRHPRRLCRAEVNWDDSVAITGSRPTQKPKSGRGPGRYSARKPVVAQRPASCPHRACGMSATPTSPAESCWGPWNGAQRNASRGHRLRAPIRGTRVRRETSRRAPRSGRRRRSETGLWDRTRIERAVRLVPGEQPW